MNTKAIVFLSMLLASIILSSAEAAPKDLDNNFNNKNENSKTNGVDESKYFGGPWHRGSGYGGGGYCHHGCCSYGYHGHCKRCCYYPGEHLGIDAEPHN